MIQKDHTLFRLWLKGRRILKTAGIVNSPDKQAIIKIGRFYRVEITEANEYDLIGRIVGKN